MDATYYEPQPDVGTICRKYAAFNDVLIAMDRPLTIEERRAFLHLLDIECSDDHPAWQHYDQCDCWEIMPRIIQAIQPDPVVCKVVTRRIEGVSNRHEAGHTRDLLRFFQGVILTPKSKMSHAEELRRLADRYLRDLAKIMRELRARAQLFGYDNPQHMIAEWFPDMGKIGSGKAVANGVAKNGNGSAVRDDARDAWSASRRWCIACGVSKTSAQEERLVQGPHALPLIPLGRTLQPRVPVRSMFEFGRWRPGEGRGRGIAAAACARDPALAQNAARA